MLTYTSALDKSVSIKMALPAPPVRDILIVSLRLVAMSINVTSIF